MGFFDSFSKKKESSPFGLSELPPPPLPQEKVKLDVPVPKIAIPPPPKIEAVQRSKIDDLKIGSASPALSQMPAPVKMEQIENASIFALPELPKKAVQKKEEKKELSFSDSSAPQVLPSMPRNLGNKMMPDEDPLQEFPDTYEEIPLFSEPPQMIALPALEISDSENENYMKPVINTKKPLYIRTDYYSNVISTIDTINDYIALSSDTIYTLENLKRNSEVEHNNYKSVMEDIQRKLIYIDKVLFEKGAA